MILNLRNVVGPNGYGHDGETSHLVRGVMLKFFFFLKKSIQCFTVALFSVSAYGDKSFCGAAYHVTMQFHGKCQAFVEAKLRNLHRHVMHQASRSLEGAPQLNDSASIQVSHALNRELAGSVGLWCARFKFLSRPASRKG